MEIVYKSDDGETFKSEEECLKHEKAGRNKNKWVGVLYNFKARLCDIPDGCGSQQDIFEDIIPELAEFLSLRAEPPNN
jgi:hypothetical protein